MSEPSNNAPAWAHLETRGEVRILHLTDPSGGFFVFNEESTTQLEHVVDELEQLSSAKGLVVIGNERGFVAGADVQMILGVEEEQRARALSERGQRLFERIERLHFPSVAAIHGPCLGGGCELALALDWRIATDSGATRVGLPEVQLGILPGFGGTQRLPRLVGLPKALDLMLKGSRLDAKRAQRSGLVDRVVPERWLEERAIAQLDRGKPKRKLPLVPRLLTFSKPGRAIVRRATNKAIAKGPGRFLDAPREILAVAIRGLEAGRPDYGFEAERLAKLAVSPSCKNLIRLFFASEEARKLARKLDRKAKKIDRAIVVGGGVMGAGIAGRLAQKGMRTRLVDLAPEALASAVARLAKTLARLKKRRRIRAHDEQAALDRLSVGTAACGFADCDLYLEAVAEKLELKQRLFAEAAEKLPDDALLATNTSSLPLARIAEQLPCPERLVGLHFFNPPEKMPLVEVIAHDRSSKACLARAARLATELGKFPVLVRDCPGFLVNRCLAPYLAQAVALVEAGHDAETIDRIATEFGMPMGPLRLLDEIGWDVAASVCRVLSDAFPDRMSAPSLFDALVEEGLLGKKSRKGGVYRHDGKKTRKNPAFEKIMRGRRTRSPGAIEDRDLLDRLLLPMLGEALRCLEEGIVDSESQLDLAFVMGIGFPPHRGGVMRWARSVGMAELERRMRALEPTHGAAFSVPAKLIELSAAGDSNEHKGVSETSESTGDSASGAAQADDETNSDRDNDERNADSPKANASGDPR